MENETTQGPPGSGNETSSPAPRSPDSVVDDLLNDVKSTPKGSEPTPQKPQYSFRTRLREETEAPFRKARMFVYGGSAVSAGVGAFIAALRIIAALGGVSGTQPLNETVRSYTRLISASAEARTNR